MKPILYAAYGSNINIPQMQHRCPTAKVIGKSTLKGYKLSFYGEFFYGAVATVEPKNDSAVPLLIWELQPKDELALNRYEGYPYLYRKETAEVILDGESISVMLYVMNTEGRRKGVPAQLYFRAIAQGYAEAGFDFAPLFYGAYDFERSVYTMMTRTIKEQILDIRDSGETNMLDTNTVQYIADREGYYELVCYIEENRKEYINFIFTGEAPMEDE